MLFECFELNIFIIIFCYILDNRLFDENVQIKGENIRLQVENEKIRMNQPSGGDGSYDNVKIQALEKKLLAQQEELTELHKRKGENSQLVIDLNLKIQTLQKQINEKELTVSDLTSINHSLRAEVQMYTTSNQELQNLNSCLRDEHTALQLAFAALEERLRKAQDENRTLVEKLMKYKSLDAEKLNQENESFLRRMGDKMRRELEDACRDGTRRSSSPFQDKGSINEMGSLRMIGNEAQFIDVLPSGVQCQFDAHDGEVNAVRWNPLDQVVATGGADRKVKLWDVGKGSTKALVLF